MHFRDVIKWWDLERKAIPKIRYHRSLYGVAKIPERTNEVGFQPLPNRDYKGGPTANNVSLATFGHTGFTGTSIWADPETQLIYVFL